MPHDARRKAGSRHAFALGVLPLLLVATTVTACAATSDGSDDSGADRFPTTQDALSVTVARTGGFAGVNQSITIDTGGAWTYSDTRTGASEQGTLSGAEMTRLQSALHDAEVAAALAEQPVGGCADAFLYTFTGELSGAYDGCPEGSPAVDELLAAITDPTAF